MPADHGQEQERRQDQGGRRSEGVLVHPAGGASWAWAGVRIGPAQLLGDSDAYPDRAEPDRLARLRARERAWLAGLCLPDGRHRFEIRYTGSRAAGAVSCSLIGSVVARGPESALAEALALRERLARPPAHVVAEPIDDVGELQRRLTPLSGRGFIAEIRKRLIWAPMTRADAPFRVGAAVLPLQEPGRSWEPIWRELLRCDHPAVVSVCLEPCSMDPALSRRVHWLAQEHARLATPGKSNPVYLVHVPPDPFAPQAAPLLAAAARRHPPGEGAFRLRVTVASEGHLPTGFAEHLAATIGGDGTVPGGLAGAPGVAGVPGLPGGPVVVVPRGAEADIAWHDLSTVGRGRLDQAHAQGVPPGHLDSAVQALGDLVDLDEAAGAFRLPFEPPNRPAIFERIVPAGPSADPYADPYADPSADPSAAAKGSGSGAKASSYVGESGGPTIPDDFAGPAGRNE